ncbi:MAG: porin [Gammaproteobacteria bacterium]
MQKKLIALAVAGVLAAPLAAQADVEIYGQARMSVDYSNNDTPIAGDDKSAFSVSSNKSRIGFKGSEDFGNGLKGLWQIEQGVKFDSGTWGNEARDTFLGLGGNFGTVLAGKLSTPYRTSTERLDVFKDTKADYNAIVGSVGSAGQLTGDTNVGNLRTNNSLAYVTPSMSGFQGTLAYVANYNDLVGGSGDNLPRTKDDGKKDAYSLSGTYDNGPLFLAAAYEALNKAGLGGGTGTPSTKSWKVGGGWNFGQGTTIGALFENMDLGGSMGDRNAWYLSGMHKMDAFNVKAAYGSADKWSGTGLSDTGAQQFSVGAGYDLSKTTEAYALYTQVSNDKFGAYGLESISGYADKSVSSFSLGIKHMFSSK